MSNTNISNTNSIGRTWADVRKELFTKEEIAESDLRVALIGELIKARKEQGITQYLSNSEKNLMDLVQASDVSKSLYILPGGTVPPNPTELLARDGLDKAIETLKKNFDYPQIRN